jgi:fucose permease
VLLFPGFGGGLEDSGWNAWIGNMRNANELLGILHGAYGLGATIGPLIATAMVTKARLPWYTFFYLMTGLAAVELAVLSTAFWAADGNAYRASHAASGSDNDVSGGGGGEDQAATPKKRTTTRRILREPLTWLLSVFLLGYVGGEVSLGGWIVTFMLRVRGAGDFEAGMAVVGFWLGLTIGRVVLGFVTGRVGEKLAIAIYLALAIALELLYWLVPNFIASAVAVAFLGFFLGPCFPAAIVAAAKLLPSDFHVSAIGVAAAMGGAGGALVPFVVGAIAQHRGVEVLQPIVLAIFVAITLVWLAIPGGLRKGGLERARESNEKVGFQLKRGWLWTRRRLTGRRSATAP